MFPRIAIIDNNTLQAMGMKAIINDLLPMVDIAVYLSYEEFRSDGAEFFIHYFVASNMILEDVQFFIENRNKTIVLTTSTFKPTQLSNFTTLNICQHEHDIVKSLLLLFEKGHKGGKNLGGIQPGPDTSGQAEGHPNSMAHNTHHPAMQMTHGAAAYPQAPDHASNKNEAPQRDKDNDEISQREKEVLALVAKGLINKEIADRLNISMTTVISHRKNITEKLHLKSVSALTIYAVTHGIISIDDI